MNLGRFESAIQALNVRLPAILGALGTILIIFGFSNTTRWAELSGAIIAASGAIVAAFVAVLAAGTTTPNSKVVVATTGGGSLIAGDAHPAVTGTPLRSDLPISGLQALVEATAWTAPVPGDGLDAKHKGGATALGAITDADPVAVTPPEPAAESAPPATEAPAEPPPADLTAGDLTDLGTDADTLPPPVAEADTAAPTTDPGPDDPNRPPRAG